MIQGHCDQTGKEEYNMQLSIERAQTVKDALVVQGVPADKVEVVGFGNEMPLVWSDQTERDRIIEELAPNRRVEISVS